MTASFAGLTYIALWLGGKLHVMDNRGEAWKTLLVMLPLLAATLIAVSRIMDARHHPFDVITGSMLGVACGFVAYRQYFPPLTEAWRKGRAYPIRTWGTEPVHPYGPSNPRNESTTALRNPEAEQFNHTNMPERIGSPPDRPSTAAAGYGQMDNPYAQPYPRRPHDHHPDGNWSSSEEDVADGYEMQPGYARAQNPAVRQWTPPPFDSNTAYHSQTSAAPGGLGYPAPGPMSHGEAGRPLTGAPERDV